MRKLVYLLVFMVSAFTYAQTSIELNGGQFKMEDGSAKPQTIQKDKLVSYVLGNRIYFIIRDERGNEVPFGIFNPQGNYGYRKGYAIGDLTPPSGETWNTIADVQTWSEANLGFKTAPGGSGATTDASDLTTGQLADARVAESNVTQYSRQVDQANNDFIKPQWYGAAMDGVTDDRAAFVLAQDAAISQGKILKIDRDMVLDVSGVGTNSIFLKSGLVLEGNENCPKIIINHLHSPAFIAALENGITIRNLEFQWVGSYDASANYNTNNTNNTANRTQLQNYLTSEKGITLNSSEDIWRGPTAFMYMFLLDASKNVTFENVKFTSAGDTANEFFVGAIKMKEEWAENSTVNSNVGTTDICENITLKNVTMDGGLMGVQGIVQGFKSEGLRSYRYSDAQTLAGTHIGGDFNNDGSARWMPPPHLVYINTDSSTDFDSSDITIVDTIDYGLYVGTSGVRGITGNNVGYCNSLKLVDSIDGVYVDGYTSYRRDGLGDVQSVSNGVFKNIYSEGTIDIFSTSTSYNSLRFLGTLDNVLFENVTIKDVSTGNIVISPIDYTDGSNVTFNNVTVEVNEWSTVTPHGVFGVWGDNNKIDATLKINTHTATDVRRSVIFKNDTNRNTNVNNSYNVKLIGWREISSDPVGLSPRALFSSAINPSNSNYAFIHDVKNGMKIEQEGSIITQTWKKDELVTLGSGTSQAFTMNIPRYYRVLNVLANTTTALTGGIAVDLGTTSNGNELMTGINNSTGIRINPLNETNPNSVTNRTVYINADGDFSSTGVVKVTLEVERVASENGAFGSDFISRD